MNVAQLRKRVTGLSQITNRVMNPPTKLIYRGATYDRETLKASNYHSAPRETPYTLCYRGVTYQVNPTGETVEMPEQTFGQKISGVTYQVTPKSQTTESPANRFTCKLIYRGNTYWTTRTFDS
jgi:Domain of unknown function (DUF4278)